MAALKEGKSTFKIRPKAADGEWGPPAEITLFIDTLAPLIVNPSSNASVGGSSVTISADEIKDDTSVTTDVSKIDSVKFTINKDGSFYAEQLYSSIGEIISPITSHEFTIDVGSGSLISWQITVRDLAGNETIATGFNLFTSTDGQIHITSLFDEITKVDSNIFISNQRGLRVIPMQPIGRVITVSEFINTIRVIQEIDISASSRLANLQKIEEGRALVLEDILRGSRVIVVEEFAQVVFVINALDVSEAEKSVLLGRLEEAGIIIIEDIAGSDNTVVTEEV